MARLYANVSSDRRKSDVGVCANEYLTVEVRWGSTYDSKHVISVHVAWGKEDEEPQVSVRVGSSEWKVGRLSEVEEALRKVSI